MTKKNYVRIADHIKKMISEASEEQKSVIYRLINVLVEEMEKDNPEFDEVKFRNAIKL